MGIVEELVRVVREDRVSGASELTLKTVELFGKLVESGGSMRDAEKLADALKLVRSSMPSIANISELTLRAIQNELKRTTLFKEAARKAVEHVKDEYRGRIEKVIDVGVSTLSGASRILTHSYSSTVASILEKTRDIKVYVTRSEPGGEGTRLAERLAEKGVKVILLPDSAAFYALQLVDAVIVGCDALMKDGAFVNKVGTRLIAVAAKVEETPFYVASDLFKTVVHGFKVEHGPSEEIYKGLKPIQVLNPYFEVTPPYFVKNFLTEEGALNPQELRERLDAVWSMFSHTP